MRNLVFILCAVLLLSSCADEFVYESNMPVEGGVWDSKQVANFEFDIQDTVSLHDFFIDVRNGEQYEFSNLFVFIEMERQYPRLVDLSSSSDQETQN
jgi:gliding motility-associated lipoprotein GldH